MVTEKTWQMIRSENSEMIQLGVLLAIETMSMDEYVGLRWEIHLITKFVGVETRRELQKLCYEKHLIMKIGKR